VLSTSILPNLHVLVIDDDSGMRTLLRRMLTRHKVSSVVEAASVEEALKLLETPGNEINFILSDWNMPGVSGFDFSRMLKSQKPIMPVLMITGRDDPQSIRLALKAGIDGYIVKPVTAEELAIKIRSIMRKTWASRAPISLTDFVPERRAGCRQTDG
jgi:two-component system, chemotaxis family, chemotaxis protein CheY